VSPKIQELSLLFDTARRFCAQ